MLEFEILVALVPLLFLLASLLLGRYPGFEAAVRLGDRIASWRRPPVARSCEWRRPRPSLSHPVRGGLLLAFGLSGRAPPA